MERINNRFETRTYDCGNGWYAEISLDLMGRYGEIYDCYLYRENIGTKMYMFGWPKKQENREEPYDWDEIEEMVDRNLEEYCEYYEEEFCEEHEGFTIDDAIKALADYYCIEPDEDGEYDLTDYDWTAGCYFNNSSDKWLTLSDVVKALEQA